MSNIDIDDLLALEMNKAILKTIQSNPTTRILNLDELSTDDIKDHLQEIHTILWSDWAISSEDSLEAAAQWFKDAIDKLYTFISSKPS